MFILASGSPRRRELIKKIASSFEVVVPNVDESSVIASPEELPAKESLLKAYAVKKLYPEDEILSCDTIVLLEGKVLGKPKDEEDAIRMLKRESGKKQIVLSGYTYIGKGLEITRTVSTEVYFNELSDEMILEYVKEKRPLDKAGAYGIQDGYPLVKEIKGSFDNVVGLPTEDIKEHCPID